MMVKLAVSVPFAVTPDVTGVIVMEVTVSAAVAVVVAVMAPEAAVRVVVPAESPVNRPPVEIDATVGSELDQQTVFPVQLVPAVSVPVLPSL
jgi:hypothetical protein